MFSHERENLLLASRSPPPPPHCISNLSLYTPEKVSRIRQEDFFILTKNTIDPDI